MQASKDGKLLWDDPKFSKPSAHGEGLTGVFAERLLAQAGIPSYPQERFLFVLDNACGSGVVTKILHDILHDRPSETFEVTSTDLADAMVDAARQRVQSAGWTNTKVIKADAQDTKLPSNHYTHVFTNFGPMLFPNPSAMLSECHRMLKPNGICGFTTWKKVGWIEDVREAFTSMPDLPSFPTQEQMATAFSKGWDNGEYIREQLARHGFHNVQVEASFNTSIAKNVEELRTTLLPILAIVYRFWSEEERKAFANKDTEKKVEEWFERKYNGGPVPWDWVALITTGNRSS